MWRAIGGYSPTARCWRQNGSLESRASSRWRTCFVAEKLRGCGTALVTPFTRDGALDEKALRGLIDWQIAEGIDFLVPCGSTGEAVTMSPAEHRRVVELTVEQVNGRVPVVAG